MAISRDSSLLALKKEITHQSLIHHEQMFKLKLREENLWFMLKLVVGYTSVIIIFIVLIGCLFIIMNNSIFPDSITTSASHTLSASVLGISASIWKIIVNPIREEIYQNKK